MALQNPPSQIWNLSFWDARTQVKNWSQPLLHGETWCELMKALLLVVFSMNPKKPALAKSKWHLFQSRHPHSKKRRPAFTEMQSAWSALSKHSDLLLGEEVLVQDYLIGLWTDLATVTSMREDRRSYWVQDKHGRKSIRRRRRLKQFSQPSEANQTSYSVQTNLVIIMQSPHSSSAWTFKVKLHKLPPSVASAAWENPLGLNQHTLNPQEYMCIFYLSDKHYQVNQPSTSKYSVDVRH